jgi:hypothetical protein
MAELDAAAGEEALDPATVGRLKVPPGQRESASVDAAPS